MDNKEYTLSPEKTLVWIIVICTVYFSVKTVIECVNSTWIITPTIVLSISSFIVLFYESKTITLSRDMLCVKYLFFFKRKISWERVQDVCLLYHKQWSVILIALDDVKLFNQPTQYWGRYISLHPIKAIAFRVKDKQTEDECLKAFQTFYPKKIRILEKDKDYIRFGPF